VPTASRIYSIFAGSPVSAALGVTLLGIGSPATPAAKRRLTHPDTAIVPVTYFANPDETDNFDLEPLPRPDAMALKTLTSTRVVRFEETLEDVIVTERWIGEGAKAAMPSFFFRQLYNLWLNPPDLSVSNPVYVQWEPRDQGTIVYKVELLSLTAGGDAAIQSTELLAQGGKFDGGTYEAPLDPLNALRTGLVPKTVELTMRIVAKV
jgi:hypothetical protein